MAMSDEEFARKKKLGDEAYDIWVNRTHRGRVRPTSKQRDVLNAAYWAGCLPREKDGGSSIYQWVEDNFPEII
jgi:hypothetical protein